MELQRVLPGISTEQLRSRLNRMVADGLLTRQRYREVPPRVDYELTERARDLMPVLGALSTWGQTWAWGRPRDGEAIDIGAILRVAPGLVPAARGMSGTVECVVEDGERTHYALVAGGGEVAIQERPVPEAEAHVRGTQSDWIAALGPDGSLDSLDITGDRGLAERMLGSLGATTEARSTAAA